MVNPRPATPAALGGIQVLETANIDGLPLGLSLMGPPGADSRLLALSRTLMRGGLNLGRRNTCNAR